jgi:hypothetical protein
VAKRIPEEDLAAIEHAVRDHPDGATAQQIHRDLQRRIPLRTLQYRLKYLTIHNRIVKEGEGRWAKYHLPEAEPAESGPTAPAETDQFEAAVPVSKVGKEIQRYLRQPPEARKPAGYDRDFLDAYHPNVTSYLSAKERAHLLGVGQPKIGEQPAGTYAKQILNKLLIDLAWNSSRLEGNTYSLLDTKRLIELGEGAQGHEHFEAQMILNHKDAIEFLVGNADEIGFNRYTILNLHALLANNLLPDPVAAGSLRHIAVGIERSVFHPLEVPQLIEECFDQILATTEAIKDPFEQSFFVMVQLPYLQPFDDVNKRVSRLAANIPLIKSNLSPLSFVDVPHQTYTEAMLGVYELNKIDLLKDVFLWAYERSAARYTAVRQSLGDPDPFLLRHRAHLREIVGEIIRGRMNKKGAVAYIASWPKGKIDAEEQKRFIEVAEKELMSLHEGNFARYQVRPSEFEAWQQVWEGAG